MTARIFRPAKSATQSGMARSRRWKLVYEPSAPKTVEPLMGWMTSVDMQSQVSMSFATKEEAIEYATRNNIPFEVIEDAPTRRRTVSYSDNFRPGRPQPWTH
jgi:recombinational DNA repair protein RecT